MQGRGTEVHKQHKNRTQGRKTEVHKSMEHGKMKKQQDDMSHPAYN